MHYFKSFKLTRNFSDLKYIKVNTNYINQKDIFSGVTINNSDDGTHRIFQLEVTNGYQDVVIDDLREISHKTFR